MVDLYTSLYKLIMKLNEKYLDISFRVAGHTQKGKKPPITAYNFKTKGLVFNFNVPVFCFVFPVDETQS